MFKNLTPHTINLVLNDGAKLVVEPELNPARVATEETFIGLQDGVEIFTITFGDVTDLPEPSDGVNFIVSKMVADACPGRKDLFYPTRLVRDEAGRVVACKGLGHV